MKNMIFKQFTVPIGLAWILVVLNPLSVHAQGQGSTSSGIFTDGELLLGLAIFLAIALVFAIGGLLLATVALGRIMSGKDLLQSASAQQESAEATQEVSFWERLQQKLSGAVPVTQEERVMTDHEYDGIRELDNSLPPWWLYLFYATIVFSVVYMGAYHVFGWGQLQDKEYQAEVAAAKLEIEAFMAANGGAINENNVEFLSDEASLAGGKSIYDANCAACHGAELQGTVGPNLTDAYWIHGGSVGDIFKTIRDGVPSKGMISWKAQLSPEQIQQVSSYIISKEGSEPAGAKEPQGELFERK